MSHIFKRTVFDLAGSMGLQDWQIVGSKLAPHPKQALQMMQDMLSQRGIAYKPGALSVWYREYKEAYQIFAGGGKGSKKAKKRVLEAHPLTTYRIGEKATIAELEGKNERASTALDDIDTLIDAPRTTLPSGLTTVDYGYIGEGWPSGNSLREDFISNYALAATGRPPSPSPYPFAPKSPTYDDDW